MGSFFKCLPLFEVFNHVRDNTNLEDEGNSDPSTPLHQGDNQEAENNLQDPLPESNESKVKLHGGNIDPPSSSPKSNETRGASTQANTQRHVDHGGNIDPPICQVSWDEYQYENKTCLGNLQIDNKDIEENVHEARDKDSGQEANKNIVVLKKSVPENIDFYGAAELLVKEKLGIPTINNQHHPIRHKELLPSDVLAKRVSCGKDIMAQLFRPSLQFDSWLYVSPYPHVKMKRRTSKFPRPRVKMKGELHLLRLLKCFLHPGEIRTASLLRKRAETTACKARDLHASNIHEEAGSKDNSKNSISVANTDQEGCSE